MVVWGGKSRNEGVAGSNGNLEALRVVENKQKEGRDCDKRVTCDAPRLLQIRPSEADWAQVVPHLTHANLIDIVIGSIGTRYTYGFVVDRFFHHSHRRSEAAELKSLALASRACNHRVWSHFFASCKVINADSSPFEHFERRPDALIGYTRILTILYDTNPTALFVVLPRHHWHL